MSTDASSQVALGNFLFRWRSYLPYLLIIPLLIALPESGWFEAAFGHAAEMAWDVFASIVAFVGLGVRAITVGTAPAGTSGRNTRSQRAECLNTTGLYSVVRNPLYLGNAIIVLGLALSVKVWWVVPMVISATWAFYARVIAAEESFLSEKFGAQYEAWKAVTPAFLPDFSLWRAPGLAFSIRNVLRREYNGFFLIVAALTLLELATDVLGEGEKVAQWAAEDMHWIWFFCAGAVVWFVLRTIKRRTVWLSVPGR